MSTDEQASNGAGLEALLLREHGPRVFRIAGKHDMDTWGYLVRVVMRWDDIERTIRDRGPGPWFFAINESSVTEVPIPSSP